MNWPDGSAFELMIAIQARQRAKKGSHRSGGGRRRPAGIERYEWANGPFFLRKVW
jgi:hypothetical protein